MLKKRGLSFSKRADSGIYQVTVAGKRISLGTRSLGEAIDTAHRTNLLEVAALAKAGALTEHAVAGLAADPTPSASVVLAMWHEIRAANGRSLNTLVRDGGVVRQFLRDFSLTDTPVSKIDERQIGTFINADGSNTASTRLRSLASLRGFFEFCLHRGYCRGNPAANVEVNYAVLSHEQKETGKHEAFTEEQYQTLITSEELRSDSFFAAAVPISYASGLRLGDIACLERSCVSDTGLAVHTEKTDSRVELPFDDAVTPGLRDALASLSPSSDLHFFPEDRAIHLDANRRSRHSVYFSRLLARVGLTGLSFHGLRATCARRWRALGFDLNSCREFLGHSSLRTTAGYTGEDRPFVR